MIDICTRRRAHYWPKANLNHTVCGTNRHNVLVLDRVGPENGRRLLHEAMGSCGKCVLFNSACNAFLTAQSNDYCL
ncbi:hypothetical protein SERLA73DRAFT_131450 [Serpula lacrymans var. lacrymans S7.3]|uniref:Uncharacterized protein n=1 Tax=Serpula lacrymans var. lacrymans (strain S7.3) TaxID=936435 RepID=F8PN22_SERL3|nr:hypothetical protein SERLA73DRAFT_131450 [Serpula lacrymans var. lacrymans S7.3]